MTVTIHVGLPNAQANTLQHLFATTPGLTYLGRGVSDELDRANEAMGRPSGWDPAAVKPVFEAAISAGAGPALLSRPTLTSWRANSPRYTGGQIAELFERPKLILVTRRAVAWAKDFYFARLGLMRPDALAGLNPWVEKHMSQLRIGSELAQVKFSRTIQDIADRCSSEQVLVLPCEMLQTRPAAFLQKIDDFVGLNGALAARAEGLRLLPDNTVSLEYADAIRSLKLLRRERERFLEVMSVLASRTHKPNQTRFEELRQNPQSTLEEWTAWMRSSRGQIRRAIDRGDAELVAAIPRNQDYDMRLGLAEYLDEIEVDECDAIEQRFGIDLGHYGYAPDPHAA